MSADDVKKSIAPDTEIYALSSKIIPAIINIMDVINIPNKIKIILMTEG